LEFLKCEKYGKLDFLITIVFFRIALLKFGNSQLNYTYSINYIIRNSNKMPFKVRMKII
jgi:recombination DNA repair RAD52 pathway protein